MRLHAQPAVLILALAAGVSVAAQPTSVAPLLDLAGSYVTRFAERFANLVSEEHYVQEVLARNQTRGSPGSSRAVLRSEFLLARVPSVTEWVPFRDVFEVNGLIIRDREDRLSKLFASAGGSAIERAREIT